MVKAGSKAGKREKTGQGRGLGQRAVSAVVLILPFVMLLGIEDNSCLKRAGCRYDNAMPFFQILFFYSSLLFSNPEVGRAFLVQV
jgi:hypothetical protein